MEEWSINLSFPGESSKREYLGSQISAWLSSIQLYNFFTFFWPQEFYVSRFTKCFLCLPSFKSYKILWNVELIITSRCAGAILRRGEPLKALLQLPCSRDVFTQHQPCCLRSRRRRRASSKSKHHQNHPRLPNYPNCCEEIRHNHYCSATIPSAINSSEERQSRDIKT